jgi:hypothetical protein
VKSDQVFFLTQTPVAQVYPNISGSPIKEIIHDQNQLISLQLFQSILPNPRKRLMVADWLCGQEARI